MTLYPEPPEINLGATICTRLKKIYYADQPWDVQLTKAIAKRYTDLCAKTRIFYPELDNLAFLQAIIKYSDADITDALRD